MRVAIISEDNLLINDDEVVVDIFRSSIDFGQANIKDYDIIIADKDLYRLNGEDIINSIFGKTKAELVLMCAGKEKLNGEIKNKKISSIIDKNNPKNIDGFIRYFKAKNKVISSLVHTTRQLGEIHQIYSSTIMNNALPITVLRV